MGESLERLRAERDRMAEVLHVLGDLGTRALPVEPLMQEIVEQVQRLTRASGSVVEVVDGEDLVYRAASGMIRAHVGLRLPRAGSLSGRCVEFREVMYSPDTDEDPRVHRAACQAIGARSMIVVPLLQGSRAVGVIKSVSPRPRAFDDIDEHALRLSAGMLAGMLAQAPVPA